MMSRFFVTLMLAVFSAVFAAEFASADTAEIVQAVETALGSVVKDPAGAITGVNLANERGSVTDDVLKQALQLPNLKTLRIAGGTITSETFRQLSQQKQLEELLLKETSIQDDDLAAILPALPLLQRLTLRNCGNITDRGIKAVVAHQKIRVLALIGMNITGKGLTDVAASPRITALDLRQCSQLTAADYAVLETMPKLSDLKLAGFAVNDEVLQSVVKLPLKNLMIEDAMISAEGFAKVSEHKRWAEKIERLELGRNSTLLDAALVPLKNFTNLKRFSVYGSMVTGEFLTALGKDDALRPKLEFLSLAKTFLTDDGAAALRNFKELKTLDVSGNALTADIAEVISALPLLQTLNVVGCGLDEETLGKIRKTVKNVVNGE